MKLKKVGFFRELRHGDPDGPVLMKGTVVDPDQIKLIRYLKNCPVVVAMPGIVFDVLSDARIIIGPAHIRTDAVWIWPEDISYYVEKHHVLLPIEFTIHVKKNK